MFLATSWDVFISIYYFLFKCEKFDQIAFAILMNTVKKKYELQKKFLALLLKN